MSDTTATRQAQRTTRTYTTPVRYRDGATAVKPDRPPLHPIPPRPQPVDTANR